MLYWEISGISSSEKANVYNLGELAMAQSVVKNINASLPMHCSSCLPQLRYRQTRKKNLMYKMHSSEPIKQKAISSEQRKVAKFYGCDPSNIIYIN